MSRFDGATVLLQWATGGLLFLWVTTRRREVGIGYGWMIRITFLLLAVGSAAVGFWLDTVVVREAASIGVAVATTVALVSSIVRRRAGVELERARVGAKVARVADMTGIDRRADGPLDGLPEFDPRLDLIAPVIGFVGLIAAGLAAGGSVWLAVLRTLVGAVFLGSITDAMLLGHWYLVQPGLARGPLNELVRWLGYIWPFEVALLLVPTGMFSVFSGSIDDGYGGILGWFWIACAITTLVLVFVTRAALKERQYAAVMAATGLLYLAILTAFGTDLVARAVLSA